jgi:hypothetical protein
MPSYQHTFHIDAAPEKAWAVQIDVERWPEWTASTLSAVRLDEGPFRLGSEARLRLRGGPQSVWRVTEFDEGRSFAWESRSPGAHSVGRHVVEPEDGGCRVTLSVSMTGWLASLLSPWLSYVSRRNVTTEAEGLKRRCEA